MSKNIIRFDQQHYDAKREILIHQILSYRRRVEEYQTLSKQVKNISSAIQNNSESLQSQNQNIKLQSQKSLSQNKFSQTLTQKQKLQRRISSSKKIKIYELQKKLFRLGKEHNQKFTAVMFDKRQLQVVQQTIQQINNLISKQQIHKNNLQNDERQILLKVQQAIVQGQAKEKEFESIEARRCMFEHEKESILRHIETLSSKVSDLIQEKQSQMEGRKSRQFIEYPLSYQQKLLSNSQQREQRDRQTCVRQVEINGAKYELVESECQLNPFLVNQEVKSIEALKEKDIQFDGRINNTEEYNKTIGNHCSSTLPTQAIQYQRNSGQQPQPKKLTTFNSSLQINQLEDKLQILQGTNCQLNNQLYLLNQQMVSIQTQAKHHQTTLHLLNNKLKSYDIFIQKQKNQQIQNISTIEQLYTLLSQKQGYRGEIRGRIGTKVQEQGLIKMLNLALQKDLSNLKQKITSLIAYKNILSHNIIKSSPLP